MLATIPLKRLSSNCTALVPYGQKGSTVGIGYNMAVRSLTVFPLAIVSQLVGHLLGDGALIMSHTSVTPFFIFTQTVKRFEYA
jgi:hypothetical protein